jgi:hypothetical protein
MIEGSGSRAGSGTIPLTIREAQKHVDPDSDPQHCFKPGSGAGFVSGQICDCLA